MTGAMINQLLKNQVVIMQQNELILQQNSHILSRSYTVPTVESMDRVLGKLIVAREVRDKETTKLSDEYDQS